MKRYNRIPMALIALTVLLIAGAASAQDKIFTGTVAEVVEATTTTGKPYVRIIVEEEKQFQGVTYKAGYPVMVFASALQERAAAVNPGETLKFVGSERSYQGRKSVTLMAFVE